MIRKEIYVSPPTDALLVSLPLPHRLLLLLQWASLIKRYIYPLIFFFFYCLRVDGARCVFPTASLPPPPPPGCLRPSPSISAISRADNSPIIQSSLQPHILIFFPTSSLPDGKDDNPDAEISHLVARARHEMARQAAPATSNSLRCASETMSSATFTDATMTMSAVIRAASAS